MRRLIMKPDGWEYTLEECAPGFVERELLDPNRMEFTEAKVDKLKPGTTIILNGEGPDDCFYMNLIGDPSRRLTVEVGDTVDIVSYCILTGCPDGGYTVSYDGEECEMACDWVEDYLATGRLAIFKGETKKDTPKEGMIQGYDGEWKWF